MAYYRCLIALFVCLLSVTGAFATPPARLRSWFVDSLTKVFPTDAPGTHRLRVPEVEAARNQHVSLQLALRSAAPISDVIGEVEPLRGPEGKVITGATVHPVGYVVVGSHTKDTPPDELVGEAPGWFPDPLLDFPLEIKAGHTHSLWIMIKVPADATPGVYRSAIVIRAGNRMLARSAFRLKVWPASLPEKRSLKVTNWFGLDDKVSRQFYGVPKLSADWWVLVENVARVMADHRQNVVLTPLMELVEPRVETSRLRYDFANFDRWVETFQRAGVIGLIEGGHLLGRSGDSYQGSLEVNCVLVEDGRVRKAALPADDPRVEPFLAGFLTALDKHLQEKGWKSIYVQHILDEPHGAEPPQYGKFAEIVRRALPGVPTVDAVDASRMPQEVQRNCDIWVPQLGKFDDQVAALQRRIESVHEVWFYTCLFPNKRYLNRLIDYPLLKVRLLHWLNFRYNLTGFLHWGWNYWTPEPMNDTQPVINANTELLPPGDAFIVYPDPANKSVFASIRYEAMREGIEDYELLRALESKDPGEAARLSGAMVTSFTEYVRDPAAFRRIERELLAARSK